MLGIVIFGKTRPHHWDRKPPDADFYDLKGMLETLVESLGANISFKKASHPSFHPNRQADLHANGLVIGSLGEVHPHLLAKLDIKETLFLLKSISPICFASERFMCVVLRCPHSQVLNGIGP